MGVTKRYPARRRLGATRTRALADSARPVIACVNTRRERRSLNVPVSTSPRTMREWISIATAGVPPRFT
jgi:hypothetical protein